MLLEHIRLVVIVPMVSIFCEVIPVTEHTSLIFTSSDGLIILDLSIDMSAPVSTSKVHTWSDASN